MLIIMAARPRTDVTPELEPLLGAYDGARTPADQEQIATRIYQLVSPEIKAMLSRAAHGKRLDPDALEALAWQALTRGLSEAGMTRLGRKDGNWDAFVEHLRDQGYPPAVRVWGQLTATLRKNLNAPYLKMSTVDELVRELNALLRRPDFFDPKTWSGVSMSDEARQMSSLQSPTASQMSRFNALALSSAFTEITVPPKPKQNFMGYINKAIVPQMLPRIYEETAAGREIDLRAIDVYNALRPFIEAVGQMTAQGTLPPEWQKLSKAQQIYAYEKQHISEKYGPILRWWEQQIAAIQPQNAFRIDSKEALRDAKALFRAHPDRVPSKLWDGEQAPYHVPKIAVAPFGVQSIERMLASSPKGATPPSQAQNAAAPAPSAQPTGQHVQLSDQPQAYQMVAQRIFNGGQFDVERAVAEFLSNNPHPGQQQVEQWVRTLPPQIGETVNDVGFGAIAQEIDQKVMEAMEQPQTQQWLSMTMGNQPRPVGAARSSRRSTIMIITPGAMRQLERGSCRCA